MLSGNATANTPASSKTAVKIKIFFKLSQAPRVLTNDSLHAPLSHYTPTECICIYAIGIQMKFTKTLHLVLIILSYCLTEYNACSAHVLQKGGQFLKGFTQFFRAMLLYIAVLMYQSASFSAQCRAFCIKVGASTRSMHRESHKAIPLQRPDARQLCRRWSSNLR